MKTFKLTKGIQIILITLFIVVVGIIIAVSVSNNKAMALSCSNNCGSGFMKLNGLYDSNYHYYSCGDCGADAGGESHSYVATAEPMGDEMHGWYYQCKLCNYGKDRYYTTGVCSDGNSDELCDYCGGWTDNTGSSGGSGGGGSAGGDSSYTYDWFDITIHHIYKDGDWYSYEYHTSSEWADQGDGTHWALCDKCGGTARFDHTFENGECKECGAKKEDCNHTEELIPAIDATCTTEGKTAGKKCSKCDEILEEQTTIPAKGHTEVTIPGIEATCTTAGFTESKICSVCNTVTVEQTIIPATGHTEETIPGKEATCTETGLTEGKRCIVSNCGEITVEQQIIPALGHTEVDIEAVEPTCTTAGSTAGKKCSVCGEVTQQPTEIPATGHNYEEGTCTECGEEEPIENIEITSTKYEIDGEYILNVQPGTKVSELKININTNATEINVYGNDEKLSDDEVVATGMAIKLNVGELSQSYTIIVKGDVNGDGTSDFKDLVTINKARLNKITLEEMYYLAADVNEDESLDLKDLSKVNRFRLNKITEL